MKAVVKLGGALFKRDPDVDALRSMGKVLSTFASEGNQLVAVAGGGQNARVYIDVARKLGADESTSDLLGITVHEDSYDALGADSLCESWKGGSDRGSSAWAIDECCRCIGC